ncbi:hypothetical protein ACFL1G_07155 [Planctomycetota bacterium]
MQNSNLYTHTQQEQRIINHRVKKHISYLFFSAFLFAAAAIVGCGPKLKIKMPQRLCRGKKTVAESLDSVNAKVPKVTPIRAHGQCLLEYPVDGKKKKEHFPVKIWANPPTEFYMQGDVAFDPTGVIVGSNESEFWLSIRPKEISGYWWGQWADGNQTEGLIISPRMLLEVIGIAPFEQEGSYQDWTLANEGAFDVLTKRDIDGKVLKKVYVYCCDYSIRKIEYFDFYGEVAAVVRLGDFSQVAEGFAAPRQINIESGKNTEDVVEISFKLSSIVPSEFSERQQRRLFTPPPPKRFKNIYRIIDGRAIEQP